MEKNIKKINQRFLSLRDISWLDKDKEYGDFGISFSHATQTISSAAIFASWKK